MTDYIELTINDIAIRYYDEKRIERIMYGNWKAMKQTNSSGYKTFWIGRIMKVHRIVYFAHNQDWDIKDNSCDNSIDHKNGVRHDNRIENLRTATNQQNGQNQVNARGTSFNKKRKKWSAQIYVNYKKIHLGYYDTEEEAHQAYLIAKPIHHARE
jgi:HNH endonuclease/AP2 domain